MFYLLDNNRIIDSNMLFAKNISLWEVKDNLLFAKSKNGKLIKPYKYNAIKKQSENVFDLVEKGDLVRVLNTIVKVEEIVKNNVMATTLNVPFDVTMIDAIYKPDDKGNYIKVWEKEEENESCNGTD